MGRLSWNGGYLGAPPSDTSIGMFNLGSNRFPPESLFGAVYSGALSGPQENTGDVIFDWSDINPDNGDVVFLIAVNDTDAGWVDLPTGWVQVYEHTTGNPDALLAYYDCDGTEVGSFTLVDLNYDSAAIWVHCPGAQYETAAEAYGSSGDPDPPSRSGFAADDIALAFGCLDDDDAPPTAPPSGYTLTAHAVSGQGSTASSNGCTVMGAYKNDPAATEDPGAFTTAGDDEWRSFTVRVSKR